MKKIWIILGIVLLIYILCGFSYSPFSKYSKYTGKMVKVVTIEHTYIGKLKDIITIETCGQKNGFGSCMYYVYYHTLRLEISGHIKWLAEEVIINVREIK